MGKVKELLSQSAALRWSIIILASIVIAANYYFYDALSAIKAVMQAELGFTSTDYGLIVAFYSVPNTFLLMTIWGGVALDRFGIRFTGILFIGLTAIGALVTAYGASDYYINGGAGYSLMESFLPQFSPQLKMMMLGRLFFGLGGETSIVVINKILVKWFKGREIAFAFSVKIAIARVGTAAALIYSPILVNSDSGWTTAVWVAALLVVASFLVFLLYVMYDVKFDRRAKSLGQEATYGSDKSKFRFNDIIALFRIKSFIYVTVLCVLFYSAVFPFLTYIPDLLHNKFGLSLEKSGQIAAILPFGTILFTPLFGAIVDRIGKSASLMIYGSIILVLVHLTLGLTNISPYIPIFLLGIAFSLVPAAMWPAVAKIVDEKRIGTAYGAMYSVQNLGLFAFPIIAGAVLDASNPKAHLFLSNEATHEILTNEGKYLGSFNANTGIQKNAINNFYVTLYNDSIGGAVVYEESHSVKTDENGNFTLHIGKGQISKPEMEANKRNVVIDKKYALELRTPLKYTSTVLMFAGLGILGLIFAFLLKREDKTSGYGLEKKS